MWENPMSAVPVEPAILSFAALPLSAKVEALAAAAIKVENDLESRGRRAFGHPGERPWDYREVVASEMLGLRWTGCNDQGALLSGGYSTSWFLMRAGVSLSDAEERFLRQYIAVAASAAPENRFAGIIDGYELNPQRPDGLATHNIERYAPFAKMLQASKTYSKVFVGCFSFVDAQSRDLRFSDLEFAGFCYVKKQFRCAQADVIVYTAGVEFPC
jgi:hypothetical protein